MVVEGTDRYFTRSLTLERAVAGILLYVENIPAEIKGYDPDTELPTGLIVDPTPFRVVSLAVVHGAALSDQVRLADRAAVAGRLAVSTYNYPFNPPTPAHTLLKIDIPASAAICNGVFVDTAPDNVRHPNSLLCGAFAMPQQAMFRPPPVRGRSTTRACTWSSTGAVRRRRSLPWPGVRSVWPLRKGVIPTTIRCWPTTSTASATGTWLRRQYAAGGGGRAD